MFLGKTRDIRVDISYEPYRRLNAMNFKKDNLVGLGLLFLKNCNPFTLRGVLSLLVSVVIGLMILVMCEKIKADYVPSESQVNPYVMDEYYELRSMADDLQLKRVLIFTAYKPVQSFWLKNLNKPRGEWSEEDQESYSVLIKKAEDLVEDYNSLRETYSERLSEINISPRDLPGGIKKLPSYFYFDKRYEIGSRYQ